MPPVASLSVKKYLPNVVGSSVIGEKVYHVGVLWPRRVTAVAFVAAALASLGCGSGDGPSLTLRRVVPAADPECGAPPDGQTLLVAALGEFPAAETTADSRPITAGVQFEITTFPSDTRVLTAQVIGTGGAIRTIGRTAAFQLGDLSDGDELPVFMAPPLGFCRTGPPAVARSGALAARTGSEVLIAGGVDQSGAPVSAVERYLPSSGAFTSLGDVLYGDGSLGLVGATMTALPDGRVLVAGGATPAFQIYDPQDQSFGAALLLSQSRAHHAAVPISATEVMLVGGCSDVDGAGDCQSGTLVTSTTIVDVVAATTRMGPAITTGRIGCSATLEADGRVLVAGGRDEAGVAIDVAERIDPEGMRAGETLAGLGGVVAPLASGASLVAFSTSAPGGSGASVLPNGEAVASPVAAAPAARAGATLTPLEDGRVLVMGGLESDSGDEAILYVPNQGRFEVLSAAPSQSGSVLRRSGHAAVRLDDGSVLVIGGQDAAGNVLGDAWIFRPDLTGPYTSDVTLSFSDPELSRLLVPRDPAQVAIQSAPVRYTITSSESSGLPSEWAVIAGPEFAEAAISAQVQSDSGVAILLGFLDAANYRVVVLLPRQPATLFSVTDGVPAPLSSCSSELIGIDELASSVDVEVELGRRSLVTRVGGRQVISCTGLPESARGLVGIGVVGDTDDVLGVSTMSVRR
jgi:hypothetical protein